MNKIIVLILFTCIFFTACSQELIVHQEASVNDPCGHISTTAQTCVGDVCGFYEKPMCYYAEAEKTGNSKICEYLNDKSLLGESYDQYGSRDGCVAMIAQNTMNLTLCDNISNVKIFQKCKRIVYNTLETNCMWGEGHGDCQNALPSFLNNSFSNTEIKCINDQDCSTTIYRYGSCCIYCPKVVNAETSKNLESWYSKNCPEFPPSAQCPTFNCNDAPTPKCRMNTCSIEKTILNCTADGVWVQCVEND